MIFCSFIILSSYSQSKNNYQLFFDLGYKTTFFDFNINGPVLGLSMYSSSKKISLNLRNDLLFKIGKPLLIDNSRSENLQIIDFRTQNYIDFDYRFDIKKYKIFIGAGIGWRYLGDKENYRFNRETGYLTFSPSVKYSFDWFVTELRGDVPLKDKYYKKYNGTERFFPITFSLFYRIKPKKNI